MNFDINEAKDAGYSSKEIIDFIKNYKNENNKGFDFDFESLAKQGYNDDESLAIFKFQQGSNLNANSQTPPPNTPLNLQTSPKATQADDDFTKSANNILKELSGDDNKIIADNALNLAKMNDLNATKSDINLNKNLSQEPNSTNQTQIKNTQQEEPINSLREDSKYKGVFYDDKADVRLSNDFSMQGFINSLTTLRDEYTYEDKIDKPHYDRLRNNIALKIKTMLQ